jgi:hypothetical protein
MFYTYSFDGWRCSGDFVDATGCDIFTCVFTHILLTIAIVYEVKVWR